MSRMVIDDEMWERLSKLLPKPKGCHGRDDRLFMEAICWSFEQGLLGEIFQQITEPLESNPS